MPRGSDERRLNLDDDLIFMDYALEIAEDEGVPMTEAEAHQIGLGVCADIVDLVEDYVRDHAAAIGRPAGGDA